MAYATVTELKQYLGATTTTDDALLQSLLDRVTKRIEVYTRRVFEAATATRYYEPDALVNGVLWLDDDLVSITTLSNGDSDATEIESDEYWLMPRNAGPPYWGIRLLSAADSSWEWDTDCWVSVLGTWGYCASPPADVVHATLRWGQYCYLQKDAPVFETIAMPEAGIIAIPQGIPADVVEILKPYRRLV